MLVSRRVSNILLVLILAVGIGIVAMLAGRVRGGPLDPPGAPAPTDASEITSLPTTISSPGAYVLKKNLTGIAGSNGITVNANDVTIDLNGFALIGPGGAGAEDGIKTGPSTVNLTVRDGTIRGWRCRAVNAGSNAGGTFDSIRATGNGAACLSDGALALGFGGRATDCLAENNSGAGIVTAYGSVIRCSARFNAGVGISITKGVARDCVAATNATGIVVTDGTVTGCTANENAGTGISGSAASITDNTIVGNGTNAPAPAVDLTVGGKSTVARNTISGNNGDGIKVGSDGNQVVDNQLAGNTNSGIYVPVTGRYSRIDSNNISDSIWGIYVDGSNNTFVRNSASRITNLRFFIGGVNNISGPEQGAIAVTTPISNPWSNLGY